MPDSQPVAPQGALAEGVPDWMRSSLLQWLDERYISHDYRGRPLVDTDLLLETERRLQLSIDWRRRDDLTYKDWRENLAADDELFLRVVDFLLSHIELPRPNIGYHPKPGRHVKAAYELAIILKQSGSAWDVSFAGERPSLQRRVAAPVAASAEEATRATGRAAEHLTLAWKAAYGRKPNPGEAYSEAVRAVEAAARIVVSPKNARATLGTMIKDLEAKPCKWRLELHAPDDLDSERQMLVVAQMMKLLWKGDIRHGTEDRSVPSHVERAHAEAAVHLATTLVQWFAYGNVVRAA